MFRETEFYSKMKNHMWIKASSGDIIWQDWASGSTEGKRDSIEAKQMRTDEAARVQLSSASRQSTGNLWVFLLLLLEVFYFSVNFNALSTDL